ncbi:MAG: hypothetical protein ACREMA_19325 [Longimicrobiales bacterium]
MPTYPPTPPPRSLVTSYPQVGQVVRLAAGGTQDPATGRFNSPGEIVLYDDLVDVQHDTRRFVRNEDGGSERAEQFRVFLFDESKIFSFKPDDEFRYVREDGTTVYTRIRSISHLDGSFIAEANR